MSVIGTSLVMPSSPVARPHAGTPLLVDPGPRQCRAHEVRARLGLEVVGACPSPPPRSESVVRLLASCLQLCGPCSHVKTFKWSNRSAQHDLVGGPASLVEELVVG
eukprot:11479017-Alexandrium_andersonii.AAC.1